MKTILPHIKFILVIVCTVIFTLPIASQNKKIVPNAGDRWLAWSQKPAIAWEDAFVTGNGRHGTMTTGKPGNERIICVHEELFIRAWDRNKVAVPNIANLMPEVRKLTNEGKLTEASKLGTSEARKQLTEMGAPQAWSVSPHPAFDLVINTQNTGTITDYRRELNMENGETKNRWSDESGQVEESIFSSRVNNVNVIRIIASKGKKLNVSLSLDETPGRSEAKDKYGIGVNTAFSEISHSAELGWLKYHAAYAKDSGGYEGLARVTNKGGQMNVQDNRLQIKDANEILIVLRITPLVYGSTSQEVPVKSELSSLSNDYAQLLAPHAKQHSEMFNRAVLDLGVAKQWSSTPTEKMLAEAHEKGITPVFLEQMYAMGRYLLISSSGKYPPPLQGIWGGGWTPAWIGGFVFDSNVNLAISAISTGDLLECAESYFGYVERLLPAWRLNARNYLGTRGFLIPHYSDPEKGYLNHFAGSYPWMYWPSGSGWNLMPFYEHGMIYSDADFLRKRVLPLYIEMGQFYEDYLTMEEDGYYHVSPGISPENFIPNEKTILCKDATIDIAVAREVFEHLLKLGNMFGLDKTDMAKWKQYHDKLVPYRINADGALAEWIPKQYDDYYEHRHNSHLYPVFPGTEFFQANSNPALLNAANVALSKRFKNDTESAHGLIHVIMMAARLHDTDKVSTNFDRFARRNYVYDGLVTSHNPNHEIYNLDSVLSLQSAIYEMLVFSQPGHIEFLPACPKDFSNGKLAGVRIHGGHKLDIKWSNGKLVSATIRAGKSEQCDFIYGAKTKQLKLEAGKTYVLNENLMTVLPQK